MKNSRNTLMEKLIRKSGKFHRKKIKMELFHK